MCRKNHMRGCCLISFAVGMLIGHCMESWFFCFFSAIGLIVLGMWIMKRRM